MKRKASFHVRQFNSAGDFLTANLGDLLRYESEYNLKIGLSMRLAEGPIEGGASYFSGVENADGRPVGQALLTSSVRPLILSHMPDEALDCLLGKLEEEGLKLTGVVGPKRAATAFAEKWAAATDRSFTQEMDQLVYEARRIAVPPSEGGRLMVADDTQFDLAFGWTEAFARECRLPEAEDREILEATVTRCLARGLLFFWKNAEGELVSMAARNRESPNGATVSYVYTPKNLRQNGYASCVVGALSQKILESGKSFCNLYTDASNRSSNNVYKRLGYEVVGESAYYVFTDP